MSVKSFTLYQKFVIAMLSFLQFTIILDFMIIAPLGAVLMPALKITPAQFGLVVSAYAFAAGVSGLLAAGFADRFDRKKMLLFFYTGFLVGTFVCGLAPDYHLLLAARVVTGLFGGVIGSITLAIMADLFAYEQRGRVMGFLQTAFGASQILGIPAGLYFSSLWGWHAPFLMIASIGVLVGLLIVYNLRPVTEHLKVKSEHGAVAHLLATVKVPRYLLAFANTAMVATGGFMMMPFGTTFAVNNLGIPYDRLPVLYLATGIASMMTGPLIGRFCDRFGKFPVFLFGAALTIPMVIYYTNLGPTSLGFLIVVQIFFFLGIFSRGIPSQALVSALPAPDKRGSFMAVNASLLQVSGGLSSLIAGLIVVEGAGGKLRHFDTLGYILTGTVLVTVFLTYKIKVIVEDTPA
jgi:predicted MFS family arabinose efflux permease